MGLGGRDEWGGGKIGVDRWVKGGSKKFGTGRRLC